jgi:HNH endonuclease
MTEWSAWHDRHENKIQMIAGVDCWIWVAGRSGGDKTHGRVSFTGPDGVRRPEYAHRAAYISAFGRPPEGSIVCHRCGVGLCVRPGHLYAGTPATNGKDTADMLVGTSLLNYHQAYDVRLRYQSGEPLQAIADRYGIAFGSVYPIVMGKSYKHVPMPSNYVVGQRSRAPLSDVEIADIRKMLKAGATQKSISQKHNVAQSIISRIKTGDRHAGR